MNPETLAEVREQVLQTLKHFKSRAIHVGELRGRIGLERNQHEVLFRILEAMAEEGLLVQMPGGRFRIRRKPPVAAPPPSESRAHAPAEAHERPGPRRGRPPLGNGKPPRERDERSGVLVVNSRGFGFVSTLQPGPDVFVPPTALGAAMHGDQVTVTVRPSPKGLEGRVLNILKRCTEYVGGQLHVTAGTALIEPDDDRIRYPIHVVGGATQKLRTGQGVIAKVLRYPEHSGDRIEAEITETFEPKEFVAFETRRILVREGAAEEFSDEALAEARALPKAVPERDKRGRTDLRPIDLVTIDPEDAKDHDDAVWAEPLGDGSYRVIVAIADVSHYVPEGSALDLEAQARGCTIYLPSHAIPMLPPEISSNLASLVPNRDRLALAVEVELGSQGAIKRYKLHEAVVRSHARLTYAGVAKALELTAEGPVQKPALSRLPMLKTLMEVAQILRRKRQRRGSLEFDLPEAKVQLETSTGRPLDVLRSRSDPGIRKAYNMIEELALLANEVVAADLTKRKLPTIYRVHAPPDEERLTAFAELANSLGFELDVEDARNPKRLSRFLNRIRKTEHAETLGYLLLRAMQQATYETHNVGHFGLAAKAYVHFTSPIRRYPDLAIHRTVRNLARREPVRTHGAREKLAEQAEQSSRLERRAMGIEREVVDLYRAMVMQDRVGEVFDATITGITDHGVFAAIDSPYVDVLCRLTALPRDRWETDAYGIRLTGLYSGRVFALGERLRVQIEDVSLARRRISAIPVEVFGDARPSGDGEGDPFAEGHRPKRKNHRERAENRRQREHGQHKGRRDRKDARRADRKAKHKRKRR